VRRTPRQSDKISAAAVEPDLEERAVARFRIVGELRRIAASIPKASWDRLPRDLSANLDHYIYGVPKR
jgi:hypothetical protein